MEHYVGINSWVIFTKMNLIKLIIPEISNIFQNNSVHSKITESYIRFQKILTYSKNEIELKTG